MDVMFAFRSSGSFLNKCPALLKFTALFFLAFVPWYITFPLYCIFAVIVRLPFKNFFKSSLFFLIIAVFIMFSTGFTDMMNFLTVVFSGILFADSTNPEDLASQLKPIIGRTLSVSILLTLAMLPMVFETIEQVRLAYKARGKKHINLSYLETIFSILLDKNNEIALACKNRGLE